MSRAALMSGVESSFAALWINFSRSLLTILGLVIAIASVIVMLAFGNGLQGLVLKQIEDLDPTLTIVLPQEQPRPGQAPLQGGLFRDRDLRELQRGLPQLRLAGAQIRKAARIAVAGHSWSTQMVGTNSDGLRIARLEVQYGQPLSERDQRSGARKVLLGATVAAKLFDDPGQAPGWDVRLNGVPMTVAGVLKSKGAGLGVDQDDIAYVPLQTARRRITSATETSLPPDAIQSIWLTFSAPHDFAAAKTDIDRILDRHYRTADPQLKPFSVVTMRDQLEQTREAMSAFTVALAGIAAISLLVGGIGIMNMMLVSVSERTSEIGLRMALGASPRNILGQFLSEALILCAIGAVLGVLTGSAIVWVLSVRLGSWPIAVNAQSVLLAVIVSTAVGLFFGFAPAVRASRMTPVEALNRR